MSGLSCKGAARWDLGIATVILLSTRGTADSDIWFTCLADKPMVRGYRCIGVRVWDGAAGWDVGIGRLFRKGAARWDLGISGLFCTLGLGLA